MTPPATDGENPERTKPGVRRNRRKRWLRLLLPAAAVIATGIFLIAAHLRAEARKIAVHEIELEFPQWSGNVLRVALLSDLHIGTEQEELERLGAAVEKVNRLRPDLILLLGDYVAGFFPAQSAPPEAIAAKLGKLDATLGVWAVLGNHDRWQGAEKVRAALEKQGIRFLENERTELEFRGTRFHLIGASDTSFRTPPDWSVLLPPEEEPEARLVMTHSPDAFDSLPDRPLVGVAGHTHGGQIRLPLLGAPAIPSRFGQRYAYGVVREGNRTFYITAGLGTSTLPWRFNCPPEIALIELRSPGEKP